MVFRTGESKEIVMTISEGMVVEPSSNSCWVDFAVACHIAKEKGFFVEMKEKKVGEHRVYIERVKLRYSSLGKVH